MEHHDVAVIGAGLSGLWCARGLARRGVDVALVDAHAGVDGFVRTTGIFVRRTLEDFDLPHAAFSPPIRRVVLYSPRRRAIEFESPRDEFWIADMRAIYRSLLDDCIRAGVAWHPRTRFTGLDFEGSATTMRLESSAFRQRAATSMRVRFVVGADGARSRVAASLGLSSNDGFLVGVEDVHDDVIPAMPATLHCMLDPALAPGYIAWVAHAGTSAHIGAAGDLGRCRPAQSLQRLRGSIGDLLTLPRSPAGERRGGLIPCNGVLPRIAGARGLLVGDAAGAVSPLTAGGLDGAVRLSEFAAHVIPEHLTGHDESALRDYDGRRFAARFIARRWMRALLRMCSENTLEAACAALATPLGRRLGEHVFFGRGSFPDIEARHPRPARVAHRLAG